jgi:hypothetical protein
MFISNILHVLFKRYYDFVIKIYCIKKIDLLVSYYQMISLYFFFKFILLILINIIFNYEGQVQCKENVQRMQGRQI